MVIVSCRVILQLPDSHSLKDKRQVVQGLVRRLRERHNISVLEDGSRDLWQKAELGLAMASRDRREAETRLESIRKEIEESTGLKYFDFEAEFL